MDILFKTVEGLKKIVKEKGIEDQNLTIKARGLNTEEAIGKPERKDYPLITGKEVMIEAEYNGSFGQAFTDHPGNFHGSLKDIINLPLENINNRALTVAAINAVLKNLNLAEKTVHCKNEEPELCAREIIKYLQGKYFTLNNILLIGFQPAMLENLIKHFGAEHICVTDLNEKTVGTVKYGVKVLNGDEKNEECISKVDLILCTGSTIVNGSINDLIKIFKEYGKLYMFFGNTISGAAKILGFPHICFKGH